MKDKFNKFLLYAAISVLIGMVIYSLVQWSATTDHADRFDWMLVAGFSAFGVLYGILVLLRARSKPQSEAAAHDK